MRILVVEDHATLRDLLCRHLTHSGYSVDQAATGEQALTALCLVKYSAMILDLGLPDMDGLRVLSVAAARDRRLACIVLSARDAIEARIAGLDAGADDYVLKPVDMSELEARLRAVLRRGGERDTTALCFGNLSFDLRHMRACAGKHEVELPRREAMLLEQLLRVAPRIAVKEHLEEQLYAADEHVTRNAVEALVSRVRRKLRQIDADVGIDTVWGLGYRLVGSAS